MPRRQAAEIIRDMAAQPLSDELRTLAYQARLLEDQIAAGEEYFRRVELFCRRRPDGVLACPYPWDLWEEWAVEDGLSPSLAELGAAVMCAAHIDDWNDNLRAECGWYDAGQEMITLGQQDPARAHIRWSYLLESDGDFCKRG